MSDTILNKETILSILRQQKDILHNQFYVRQIGLFGSFATNKATDKSDIDFLVEFEDGNLDYYTIRRDLHDFLGNKFQREIDIAITKSLKPFFKDMILKQAVYA